MLNKGKTINYDETTGFPVSVSFGDHSPMLDPIPLKWRIGDRRYPLGPAAISNNLGWICNFAGTPGNWTEVRPSPSSLGIFLSYGGGSAGGQLPTPPEASPAFYLRADTDNTVPQSFSGSPGSIWEFVPGVATAGGRVRFNLNVYSCALTGFGPTPGLFAQVSWNGGLGIHGLTDESPNLDGMTNTEYTSDFAIGGITQNDKLGIHIRTENISSGYLVMTANIQIFLQDPP